MTASTTCDSGKAFSAPAKRSWWRFTINTLPIAPTFEPIQVSGEELIECARRFKSLVYSRRGVQVWKNAGGQFEGRTHCWGLLILTAIEAGLLPQNTCPNLLPFRENLICAQPRFREVASERVMRALLPQNARRVGRGENDVRENLRTGDVLLFRYGLSSHNFHVGLVADGARKTILHAVDQSVSGTNPRTDRVFEEAIGPDQWQFIRSLWRLNGVRSAE